MLTKSKRRILFWFSTLFFIVLLGPIFLFSFGYGIGSNFKIQKTGGISISTNISNAIVSGNFTRKKKTSALTKNALVKNLVPGKYEIKVEKDGFWDWEKTIRVESEKVSFRDILLIPRETNGTVLGTTTLENKLSLQLKKHSLYKNGELLFANVKNFWELPQSNKFLILGQDDNFYRNSQKETEFSTTTLEILKQSENAIFSEDETEIIYWDAHRITLLWIDSPEKMPQWRNDEVIYNSFASITPIKNVINYPSKPDYLIISQSNGIWALEKEGPKNNIATLYKGKDPKIISIENGTLIILDDKNYIKIELP